MISIRGLRNKKRFHLPLEIFYNSLHIRKKMRFVHSLNSLFIESYLLSLPLPPRKNVYYIIHDTRFSQPLCRSWSEREREKASRFLFSPPDWDSRLGLWFRECWYIAKDFAFRIRDKRVAWKKSASRKPGSNLGKKNVCALESNGYVMKFLMEL